MVSTQQLFDLLLEKSIHTDGYFFELNTFLKRKNLTKQQVLVLLIHSMKTDNYNDKNLAKKNRVFAIQNQERNMRMLTQIIENEFGNFTDEEAYDVYTATKDKTSGGGVAMTVYHEHLFYLISISPNLKVLNKLLRFLKEKRKKYNYYDRRRSNGPCNGAYLYYNWAIDEIKRRITVLNKKLNS